ncbi:MAG: SurA N-terminal domain-containing protein [Planctomycetaceae bacterium]|jgi:hypothetical protein|nr:SurA N-terminal domain-containing protein [Planctomycetaceae bacterium]
MAFHPFRSFQRNQKFWLAILGVGTMISFIILPVLMQLFSGSGGGTGPGEIAYSRRYGRVNEQTLAELNRNREDLGRFYFVLYQQLADPGNQEQMMTLRNLEMTAAQYDQALEQEELVNQWLLAQYAKDQGMSIDKTDITNHLKQLTGNLLTKTVYQKTLESVGMSEQRFEYLINSELLCIRMDETFGISLNVIPPATRWDWFQRLNRQITAEIAAIPVDQFVDKIAAPNNAQLQKFFDNYKDKPFNPTLLDSGFTVPEKMAFQYVEAVPGQKILDSISEEEIKKYYEENKEAQFRKPVQPIGTSPSLPSLPGQNLFQPGRLGGLTPTPGMFPTPHLPRPTVEVKSPEVNTETPLPPQTEPVPAADEKKEEPKTEPIPSTNQEIKPAVEEKPEPPKSEPAKPESVQPEPVKPEPPKSEPVQPKPVQPEPEKKETSAFLSMRTRFVSYQTETETEKSTNPVTEPAQQKPEEPKAEVKPEPTQQKPEELKAEVKPEPTQQKVEEPVDLSILYRPFDEVKEQIRLTLATEKVMKSIALIEEKMRDYFQVYNTHLDQEKAAPPMPDLTAFVEEQGLVLKTVPLETVYGALKSEFARGATEREYLFNLFNESPIVFEPKKVGSGLLWVTEIQPENKPEKLEEIKETVLKRWKEVEARPLALKRAEELAMEVRSSEKSLAETFLGRSDVPVVETEPFTYKSYGASMYAAIFAMRGIPPRLGEVCEKGVAAGDSEIGNKWIAAPGVEFLETASSLSIGEVGVVFNQPQTVAYIIRITGSSPSEEVLWEQFQNASMLEYRLAGYPELVAEARNAWLNKIYEESGFKWVRKPESVQRRR